MLHVGMGFMVTEKFLVSLLGTWFNTGLVMVYTRLTDVKEALPVLMLILSAISGLLSAAVNEIQPGDCPVAHVVAEVKVHFAASAPLD